MDRFCRGCLVRYEEPTELLQYTEKNRRLFVYCTGLQVKRADTFTFQLCRGCYVNMKVACNFKKQCRNSDRLFKSYQGLRDNAENIDLSAFLKNNDDSWSFRFPGSSTPAYQRVRDDDNESTTTSIRNFMNDIMPDDDLPDTEARIIKEVIDEEADVLDDSLDSHWLRDDASIDSDFRLDISFSPFSTPRRVNDDQYTPQKQIEIIKEKRREPKSTAVKKLQDKPHTPKLIDGLGMSKVLDNLDMPLIDDGSNSLPTPMIEESNLITMPSPKIVDFIQTSVPPVSIKEERNLDETMDSLDVVNEFLKYESENNQVETETDRQCTIDRNLEEALKNTDNKEYSLDELLVSPKVIPDIKSPATPFINNLLFSEKLDINENSNSSQKYKPGQHIEAFQNVTGDVEMTEEFSENYDIKLEELDIEELKTEILDKIDKETNQELNTEILDEIDKETNQEEENHSNITNFYCHMCRKTFKNLKGLKRHSTAKHSAKARPPRILICDYCGVKSNNRTNFVRHLQTHQRPPLPKLECDICKVDFPTPHALRQHKRSHTGEKYVPKVTRKRFVCSECGATTDKASNHAVHMKRHAKEYKFTCPECNKGFYRHAELTVHMRYHTGEKPFSCPHCEKKFARRDCLTRHTKHHLDLRPFTCVYCKSRFITSHNLKHHLEKSTRCIKDRDTIARNQKKLDENSTTKSIVTEEILEIRKGANVEDEP